jgi:hypothetical protein
LFEFLSLFIIAIVLSPLRLTAYNNALLDLQIAQSINQAIKQASKQASKQPNFDFEASKEMPNPSTR